MQNSSNIYFYSERSLRNLWNALPGICTMLNLSVLPFALLLRIWDWRINTVFTDAIEKVLLGLIRNKLDAEFSESTTECRLSVVNYNWNKNKKFWTFPQVWGLSISVESKLLLHVSCVHYYQNVETKVARIDIMVWLSWD